MINPKIRKLKMDKSLSKDATPEWMAELKQYNWHIPNLLLGNVSASGFLKKPNYMGAIMQPFATLGDDFHTPSHADIPELQPSIPGTGFGYLVPAFRSNARTFQTHIWEELVEKRDQFADYGLQAMYTPSSLPVECIAGDGSDSPMPTTIGIFLGHCRRQLNLQQHLGVTVDWTIPLSSFEVPTWETHSLPVAPPEEAFSDLVFPAIGEYLAILIQVPQILEGKAEQVDNYLYRSAMSATVLANLKSFAMLHTRISGFRSTPNLLEFKARLDFAEKFVDAVADEIITYARLPKVLEAIDTSECKLLSNYISAAAMYGSTFEYQPFNRGRLVEGIERHQADIWKCNRKFITSRIERNPARKRYQNYFTCLKDARFDAVARKAYHRTYPEGYVAEVLRDLDWMSWSAKMAKTTDKNHLVWDLFKESTNGN